MRPECSMNHRGGERVTEIGGLPARSHAVRDALKTRVGKNWPQHMKPRAQKLDGQLDQHPFDVVIGNGRPRFAAQGLSFER